MELRDYVRVLRRGWAVVLAITLVGVALGVGLTLLTTKVYQANAQVFVSSYTVQSTSSQDGLNTSSLQARVSGAYPDLATAPEMLAAVLANKQVTDRLDKTDTTLSASDLKKKISADVAANSFVVSLHVQDTNAETAALLANALTDAYVNLVPNFYEQQVPTTITQADGTVKAGPPNPAVQMRVTQEATVPAGPIKPNKIINIGVGFVIGLLVGVGVALMREILDNTVKGASDFEELGIPLLAQVVFDKRAARTPIAFRGDAHSPRSEAYRQLRTNLQFVDIDNPPRIISITSAVPGEGKSSTAINLAAALAEAGSRVCLIEADLRRPSIAKALGLVSDVGFTTAVIGKAPIETVLQNAGKNLAVLTCGPIPPNPSELLLSKHAKQVIYDIADKVDYVIIDTPPLLPVTDGAEISTIADATLLVHRAARTTRDQAARSLEALEKVGRRPVGVILNMVTRGGGGGRYDYEYGYYYSAYRPRKDADAGTPAAADGEVAAPARPATNDPFGTGEALDAPRDERISSARDGERRRRGARHRGAGAATSAAPATPSPATEDLPVAPAGATDDDSFMPVDAEVTDAPNDTDAFAPVDDTDIVDAEIVGGDAAPHSNGVPRSSDREPVATDDDTLDALDDAYDYDDYYDEDPTETFAPVPDTQARPDATEVSLEDRANGRSDASGDRAGRRGRRGRR